jgi:hypothetical protein
MTICIDDNDGALAAVDRGKSVAETAPPITNKLAISRGDFSPIRD